MNTQTCRTDRFRFPVRAGAITVALAGLLAAAAWPPGAARSQCVDYRDYLHRVSTIALAGAPVDVAFVGGYALVAGTAGLDILDVADPEAPVLLSHLALPQAQGIKVDGGLAYIVCDGDGLHVVDIAVLADPQPIGFLPLSGDLRDVEIDGLRAYVAAGLAGLHVIDIADPAAPWLLQTIDTESRAYDVAVRDGCAFVADGGGLFVVIDLANPVALTAAGGGRPEPYYVAVTVAGDAAYLLDAEFGIQVFDISVPLDPTWIAGIGDGGQGRLIIAGGRLYASAGPGLQIFDLSAPFEPQLLGEVNASGASRGLSVAGSLAALVTGDGGSLDIIDVEPPLAPERIGTTWVMGWANSLAVAGRYAFIACRWDGLVVVDVADPSAPVVITDAPVMDYALHLRIRGDYAYVACGTRFFQVVDISMPQAPRVVGSVSTPGPAQWVALQDDLAYVADEFGLRIIDIADPAAPRLIGGLETPGTALAVEVSGSVAYVADDAQLLTVDVSAPKAPAIIAGVGAWAETVGLYEGLVYTVDWRGLQVWDVANPTAPSALDSLRLPAFPLSLGFASDMAYVAAYGGGLQAVDVSEAGRLRALGSIACYPAAVWAEADYLYVTEPSALAIYPAHCDPTAAPGGPASSPAAAAMLHQNHPNPFNPSTTVGFTLPRAGHVRLTVHNLAGARVATPLDEPRAAGEHNVVWNGRDARGARVASGVYFCRLSLQSAGAAERVETARMVIIK